MHPLVNNGDLLIWDYYNNSRRRSTNFNNSSITQQRRPANWDFSNKYLRRSPGLNNASVSQQWRPDYWEFSNNCRQRSSSFNNVISQQLNFLTTATKGRPVSTMQLVNSSSFVKKNCRTWMKCVLNIFTCESLFLFNYCTHRNYSNWNVGAMHKIW